MTFATEGNRSGVTRRQALKRGAAVGAAAVWTVPAIQVVSLTAAHADSPSAPPPHNPPPSKPPENPPVNPPATTPHTPPSSATPTTPTGGGSVPPPAGGAGGGGTVPGKHTTGGGQLAETGLSVPLVPTVAVAAGMIATGIAAQAARKPLPAYNPED
jgi:hypothetical protein